MLIKTEIGCRIFERVEKQYPLMHLSLTFELHKTRTVKHGYSEALGNDILVGFKR